MYTTLHCICLRKIRHSDSKSILSVWSREHGRLSLAMPEGNGREAVRRRALTMPLCMFEGECDLRPNREIHSVRDLKLIPASVQLHSGGVKSIMACFLADILEIILRQTTPDEALWAFLEESVESLSAQRRAAAVANFHLVFLYRLTHFLGIEPDFSDYRREGCIFDLYDGRFRVSAPVHGHFVESSQTPALHTLGRLDYRTMHLASWSREERNEILDYIIDYYRHHFPLTSEPRSLDILRGF